MGRGEYSEEGSGIWGKGAGSGESRRVLGGAQSPVDLERTSRGLGRATRSRKRIENAGEGRRVPGRGLGFGVGARGVRDGAWDWDGARIRGGTQDLGKEFGV